MTTDLVLAVCPCCGSGIPTCAETPLTAQLRRSWHECFCRLAERDRECDGCDDTGF